MLAASAGFGDVALAAGPVTGLLALVTLLLLSRFVFGTGRRHRSAAAPDFGLLVPVTALPTRAAAEVARQLLTDAGVRSTLADRPVARQPVRISADGRELPREPQLALVDLLVFPADIERARSLLHLTP